MNNDDTILVRLRRIEAAALLSYGPWATIPEVDSAHRKIVAALAGDAPWARYPDGDWRRFRSMVAARLRREADRVEGRCYVG